MLYLPHFFSGVLEMRFFRFNNRTSEIAANFVSMVNVTGEMVWVDDSNLLDILKIFLSYFIQGVNLKLHISKLKCKTQYNVILFYYGLLSAYVTNGNVCISVGKLRQSIYICIIYRLRPNARPHRFNPIVTLLYVTHHIANFSTCVYLYMCTELVRFYCHWIVS